MTTFNVAFFSLTEYIRKLPLITDGEYIADVHKELTLDQPWTIPGLQGVAQLAWGLTLRQLSQYQTPAGMNNQNCIFFVLNEQIMNR